MKYAFPTAISLCAAALWLVIQGAPRHAASGFRETTPPPLSTKAARERATAHPSGEGTGTNRRSHSGQRSQVSASSPHSDHNAHDVRKSRLSGLATRSDPGTREDVPAPAWLTIRPAAAIDTAPRFSPTGPYETPQPAALVDMGDMVAPNPAREAALQDEAERLAAFLTTEAADGSPQAFATIPKAIAEDSDIWFRQRFGGWLWMQHHIQAHHLAASAK